MGIGVSRTGLDAWVGVDPSIGRYVRALEIEINNFDVTQDVLRLDHMQEIAKLQRQLAERDHRVAELERKLTLIREAAGITSRNSSDRGEGRVRYAVDPRHQRRPESLRRRSALRRVGIVRRAQHHDEP